MVDVNNIMASANININAKQTVLGLIATGNGENRFYFTRISTGNSISAQRGKQSMRARKSLMSSFIYPLDFRHILDTAGGNVVESQPDGAYLDLSPETLDKTTIIDLIEPPLQGSVTAPESPMSIEAPESPE
jgi:hypothetical protein